MVTIQKNIKFWLVVILPVYFFIVQNSIQNKHTHFYPGGIVVTHSHPLGSDESKPANDHRHTKTEICFFHQVNFDNFTFTPQLEIARTPAVDVVSFFLNNEKNITPLCIEQPVNRGPPNFFS